MAYGKMICIQEPPGCGWIVNEQEFGEQVDTAMGCLWYSDEASKRPTIDVFWINQNPHHRVN